MVLQLHCTSSEENLSWSNSLICALLQVATNWNETSRAETSPENDYTNNEANVPIEISGGDVSVLTDAEAQQDVERAALVAPQLTGLATWCWIATGSPGCVGIHSGHAAEPTRKARPKTR